ncbi:MAG: TerC family protein [Dialister sp.]|jgi:integral membrane protein, YjbE family|uniref:TerC family protein n=2 Tax=Dialister pneumosintes TaxID=39950 RepID=A0ABX9MDZ0_9FIRM|nr:TerC family protein [Dialister sp.]RID95067.1 TerC family protein [Dialister pneumosintes]
MIIKVILLDVALGADNSAIIGMAARNLNVNLRKKAILIGTGGAIVARFVLAAVATYLMQILFLKTVGAIILIFIGINLIAGEETDDKEVAESNTLLGAIKTIIIADVIMSLDNVLAIVGATDGHLGMLIFGMIISVPIIIFGSTIVLKLMDRFPVTIYLAGMVIGWAAGGMIGTDTSLGIPLFMKLPLEIGMTILILILGIFKRKQVVKAAAAHTHNDKSDK